MPIIYPLQSDFQLDNPDFCSYCKRISTKHMSPADFKRHHQGISCRRHTERKKFFVEQNLWPVPDKGLLQYLCKFDIATTNIPFVKGKYNVFTSETVVSYLNYAYKNRRLVTSNDLHSFFNMNEEERHNQLLGVQLMHNLAGRQQ